MHIHHRVQRVHLDASRSQQRAGMLLPDVVVLLVLGDVLLLVLRLLPALLPVRGRITERTTTAATAAAAALAAAAAAAFAVSTWVGSRRRLRGDGQAVVYIGSRRELR